MHEPPQTLDELLESLRPDKLLSRPRRRGRPRDYFRAQEITDWVEFERQQMRGRNKFMAAVRVVAAASGLSERSVLRHVAAHRQDERRAEEEQERRMEEEQERRMEEGQEKAATASQPM